MDIPAKQYKPDPDGGQPYIEATYIGEEMGTYKKNEKKRKVARSDT